MNRTLLNNRDSIKDFFKSKYKINIEEANFSTGWIPKYILLDRTRNIHSYAVFVNSIEISKEELIEYSKIRYSSLDRPLFIFHYKHDETLSFFEINDFKNNVFSEKKYESINLWNDFNSVASKIKAEL
ncbi:hypothetical protein [Kordia zhangzhouensis]|uniref:hypothetical protein n=1 Tax=Kordia zhangzhouensis TaxID=1620405 RepID=UPI00069B784B|nr:hypothetical protein [Kordia zhangzhouensis]